MAHQNDFVDGNRCVVISISLSVKGYTSGSQVIFMFGASEVAGTY